MGRRHSGHEPSLRMRTSCIRRRTIASVQLWVDRGGKRSMEREEPVGDRAEGRVVVEASPCSTLEVVEAELALELLVVALDAPAQLREANQLLERGGGRERREPELGRCALPIRPLAEEP